MISSQNLHHYYSKRLKTQTSPQWTHLGPTSLSYAPIIRGFEELRKDTAQGGHQSAICNLLVPDGSAFLRWGFFYYPEFYERCFAAFQDGSVSTGRWALGGAEYRITNISLSTAVPFRSFSVGWKPCAKVGAIE